ncbi:hypothetical protein Hanom_Chr07g00680261 [Helianthus anomalus]
MVLISGKSVIYRSNIGQISNNIVDIIGTDILTNILYRYLGKGPITDMIYRLIYRDINYIGQKYMQEYYCSSTRSESVPDFSFSLIAQSMAF